MNFKNEIEKLRIDEHYYGKFGKQYLSNSDINTLLNNPLNHGKPSLEIPAFLVGGYFHTAILEPEKLDKFKEVDNITLMIKKINDSQACSTLIKGIDVEHEKPMIKDLFGRLWKGKADIVNHDEQLIVDLKTTADISRFRRSAYKYGYDSQAYIYKELFGYDFVFLAIDKKTHQIGIFDCSRDFYASGKDKVEKAVEAYELFYNTKGFDPKQYFLQETL